MSLINKALLILMLLCISNVTMAQTTEKPETPKNEIENPESKDKFNTWSLGLGVTNLKTYGDLSSFSAGQGTRNNINIGGYINIDKMFNPVLGLGLKMDYSTMGANGRNFTGSNAIRGIDEAIYGNQILTMDGYKYGFELAAILNLTNLWKLNSNRWTWSVMPGFGVHFINGKLYDEADNTILSIGNDGSLFSTLSANIALGVKYRLNRRFDIEFKPTFSAYNTDMFDVSASTKKITETSMAVNLGLVYKFGKEKRNAVWATKEDIGEDKFKVVDSDEDGVIDELDKEPDTPTNAFVYGSGVAVDSDMDGVPDYKDKCPHVKGIEANEGCPEDKDGDGVYDYDDLCPEIKGDIASLGCPKGQTPDDITNRIFLLSKSIYFKSDSDQIKGDSYTILNEIANIMLQYPNTKFNIDGHTDNTASANYNLRLSEKRAASVSNYLSDKGVRSDRLFARGYGIEKPTHSNNTAEGRRRNRRVEINYIQPDSENGKEVYEEGINVTESLSVLRPQAPGLLEDADGDGVADQFDQEPDTFYGSLVYGNGVALDTDKDGVIDLFDKCPLVSGTAGNEGCPEESVEVVTENQNGESSSISITDTDGDGVMDLLDADNNTPQGAKVYGNGIAIDTDNDGIIDLNDDCPLQQGTEENNGCPQNTNIALNTNNNASMNDADGDGVIDSLDQEPNTAPNARVYGNGVAVDTDGDKIPDHLDKCPLKYGAKESEGCPSTPDKDGDGVPNEFDKEPNTPFGVKVYGNGVAMDLDSDGTPDYKDACPLAPGESAKGGCPDVTDEATGASIDLTDTDNDGVMDQFDAEPNTPAGAKVYGNGVSVDSDNDGIADHSDNCPNESGSEALSGCAPEKKISVDASASANIVANNQAANSIKMTDSDNDGVMDQFDKDPNTPAGALVYGNGIPIDSDRDGLPDYKDKCPLASGPVENDGCPESTNEIDWADDDGDGVVNEFDKEPNTPADARVYGDGVAIDSDYDEVPDYRDQCPFKTGSPENKGCPEIKGAVNQNDNVDTDKDGIMDMYDKEPNTPYGVKVYSNGVSLDSDQDSVPDYKDRCPLLKGLPDNEGCPKTEDLDGDGVNDKDDLCPDVFGTAANKGCPDKTFDKSVFLRIEASAQKIYFERTKNTLTTKTTEALDEILLILQEYPATQFEIAAHTDNKHNEKYSLFLSKRRANAILKYLVDGGIDEDRLSSEGYGDTQPKYSNTGDLATSELNNRIEFNYKTR